MSDSDRDVDDAAEPNPSTTPHDSEENDVDPGPQGSRCHAHTSGGQSETAPSPTTLPVPRQLITPQDFGKDIEHATPTGKDIPPADPISSDDVKIPRASRKKRRASGFKSIRVLYRSILVSRATKF